MKTISIPILIVTLGWLQVSHAAPGGGEGPHPHEDHVDVKITHSQDLKLDYSEIVPLFKLRYQALGMAAQLESVDRELTGDLHQLLGVRSNPLNFKDKKWSAPELDAIIAECLAHEGKAK